MSFSEFLSMGGYGFYVWGSYGVTFAFMAIEVFLVIRNKRTIMQRLTRMVKMNRQVNK